MSDKPAVYSVIAGLPESPDESSPELTRSILSEQESAKFDTLKSSSRRNQFVFARYLLKQVLVSRFSYDQPLLITENGRPYVREKTIDISISHSQKWVAVVVGIKVQVGIDIEYKKPRRLKDLYQHAFNKADTAWLDSTQAADLDTEFYRLWTAKEAIAKLTQTDLMPSLKQFLLEGYFVDQVDMQLKKTDVLITSKKHKDYFLSIAYKGVESGMDSVNVFERVDDDYIEVIPSSPLSVYTCV